MTTTSGEAETFVKNFEKKYKPEVRRRSQPFLSIAQFMKMNEIDFQNLNILLFAYQTDTIDQRKGIDTLPVLGLTSGSINPFESTAEAVKHELSRQRIPLSIIQLIDDDSNELELENIIKIKRSALFTASKDLYDHLTEKMCVPTSEPLPELLVPPRIAKRKCHVTMKIDMMMILDGSFSTQLSGFRIIKKFLNILTTSMTGDINYSAIQYSDIVKTEFPFRKREIPEVLNRLRAVKYQAGYSTKTGAALSEGYKRIRSKRFGARSGTTKVILVMTDGKTKDDIKAITDEIRANGDAVVVAVGLKKAPIKELMTIATNSKLVFYTKHISRIWNFLDSLTQRLCHVKSHPTDVTGTATTAAPETTMTVTELSQELTTSLSDLGTVTTTKAAVATTATTPAEPEVPEVIEPKTSVLILPKDFKPEEVIRLAESLPVENIKIIVDSNLSN